MSKLFWVDCFTKEGELITEPASDIDDALFMAGVKINSQKYKEVIISDNIGHTIYDQEKIKARINLELVNAVILYNNCGDTIH